MTLRQQNVPEHLKKYLSDSSNEDNINQKSTNKKKKKKPIQSTSSIIINDVDSSYSNEITNKKSSNSSKHNSNENEIIEQENEEENLPAIANLDRFNLNKDEINSLFNNSTNKNSTTSSWIKVNNDLSPPRNRNGEDDISPPRNRNRDEDLSPQRNRNRDEDLSPQRNRNRDEDLSPPRNRNRDEDLSPPRNRNRNEDLSPPRNRNRDEDLSPPRNRNRDEDLSPPRKRPLEETNGNNTSTMNIPMEANKRLKMSHGGDAGLHTGSAIKEQALKRAREIKESFQKADQELLGKNAQVVHRDKLGRRIEQSELERQEKELEKQKEFEWGKSGGLVQKQQKDELIKRVEEERSKSFSRYANDKDLNNLLKNKDIWGDPMAFKKKSKSQDDSINNDNDNSTGSQTTNTSNSNRPTKPIYKGKYPPNRYNITPGYKWDGVDRSNGFEKALFMKQSQLEAKKQEAYFWSTEDM